MAFRTNLVPAIEERTVSGSSVSFNSAFALPLKACKVSFSATQEGSGEPSPSNPRAISGVSAIGLTANSTPVSVSLGDTRYGGELDVLTGILTVTDIGLNLGQLTWQYVAGCFLARNQSLPMSSNDSASHVDLNVMFDIYKVVSSWNDITINVQDLCGGVYQDQIRIANSNYTDAPTFKTAMKDHYVVYQLATPITIQLSANELSSILGNNTFSTDTGTLEITFADLQEKSASGSVASFNTALAMPLSSCNIAVNAWQEGSGDPSPVNNRPIHGFSEVNATRAGKNLFGGSFNVKYPLHFSNDKALTFSAKASSAFRVEFFDINQQSLGYTGVYSESGDRFYRKITYPVTAFYVAFRFNSNISDMQISSSNSVDYEPYTGNIYTIQLGQEVYGGTVDLVSGLMTIEWDIKTVQNQRVNVGNSSYIKSDACDGFIIDTSIKISSLLYPTVKSNYLRKADWGAQIWARVGYPNYFMLNNQQIHFNIANDLIGVTDYTTETIDSVRAKLSNYLQNNPLDVLVPIDEPFTVQLTPTQIETLIGNNTIFADTGDIDLTYKDLDIAKRGNFREVFKLPS